MKIQDTIYLKYDNGKKTAWIFSTEIDENEFKDIVFQETRKMLVADDGLALYKGDDEIGQAIWLREGDKVDDYREDEPAPIDDEIIEDEMEEEQ